jgi:predicted esterase
MSATTPNELGFKHHFVRGGAAEGAGLPTLLLLHGTGGGEDDLLDLGRMLLPGANLLSPRGKVLENGLPRFFRRLAAGVFDLEDLRVRTNELAGFIEAAAATYGFDPGRVIAVGYSNGANIAGSLLLSQPLVLAGAALFHPMVPFVPETLPELQDRPVFIGAGRQDPIVPIPETERLAALLRNSGADVKLVWQAGGHHLGADEVEMAQHWLAKRFPTEP